MGQEGSKAANLTKEDLDFVRNSWKVVMNNAEENAIVIFKTFLMKHEYLPHFKKFSHLPYDQLDGNAAFRNHALSIIKAINAVITNLDNEKDVKSKLIELGKSHAKRKITEQQFQELKVVILEILETAFKLSDEVLDAWKKALNYAFVFVFEGLASDS